MNSLKYRKSQLKYLSSILNIDSSELLDVLENINEYYEEWVEVKIDKVSGQPKKYKDGTEKHRVIRPSKTLLKNIQKRIKDRILAKITLPENVFGGVKGKNNILNAKMHQGKKYKLTTDLLNFYPSINSIKVYNSFISIGYSNVLSNWLTKLSTWKHEVPQGAPTSTHIANLVFYKIDLELIKLCKKNDITYSRYIDDLTFSSQNDFVHLISNILEIIKKNDFNINYRKTKYSGNQTITGIEVYNNFIHAPLHLKLKSDEELRSNSKLKPFTNYVNRIKNTNKK